MIDKKSGKKLLVADDSLTIQKVIALALSNEGYEIKIVSNGSEAMEAMPLFRPDIVIIDVSLPLKSAFELKDMADSFPELTNTRYIIMASAFEHIDDQKVKQYGFQGILTKPFDPAQLRRILMEAQSAQPARSQFAKSQETPDTAPSMPLSPSPLMPTNTELGKLNPTGREESEILIMAPENASAHTGSTDIQKLASATLKMSGLDELNWSVNESGRAENSLSHGLPPLPPPIDVPLSSSLRKEQGLQIEPDLDPLSRDSRLEIDLTPESSKEVLTVQIENQVDLDASKIKHPSSLYPESSHPPITLDLEQESRREEKPASPSASPELIREMVEQEIYNTVQKMLLSEAHKIIPTIAEKIIKEEIRKLIAE